MSIPHIKAALNCREFTGNTRLLLIVLADSASNGKSSDGRHNLTLGYTSKSLLAMMKGVNTKRSQTVSAALKELRDAGAIKTFHRKRKTSMTFVDIAWLEARAYTEEDNAKRTGSSNHLFLDSAESAQSTSTPCVDNLYDNAKRTSKTTQSAPGLRGFDNGKRTTNTTESAQESRCIPRRSRRSTHNRIAARCVSRCFAAKRRAVASLKNENQNQNPNRGGDPHTPQPVTQPASLPLTLEETCAECGGFWLDCPPSHKHTVAGKHAVAKPELPARAAFEVEEDLKMTEDDLELFDQLDEVGKLMGSRCLPRHTRGWQR